MKIPQFIDVSAFKFKDKFILITDKQFICDNNGVFIYFDDDGTAYDIDENQFIKCKFDIYTKQIIKPITFEVYAASEFTLNAKVVYLYDCQTAEVTSIIDIKYPNASIRIAQGKRIEKSYQSMITDFSEEKYYELKVWRPLFVLSNGISTYYEESLRKLKL